MTRIKEHVALKTFNTFGIDSSARYFAPIASAKDFLDLRQEKAFRNNQKLILGGGSNILLTGDFDGLVIANQIKGIAEIKSTPDHVWVQAGAGENWHQFVLHCLSQNLGGIENLSLIPGNIGAAPMQNIGAYGVELESVFDHLVAVEMNTGVEKSFDARDCNFGYRDSFFKNEGKGRYFITNVTLRLTKTNHKINTEYGAIAETLEAMKVSKPNIRGVSNAVIKIRQSKLPDPSQIGNAGSFFKNPEIPIQEYEALKSSFLDIPGYPVGHSKIKVPAGWLIEKAGWKGYRNGDIGVHKNQALVLVNYGSGKGGDIYDLALNIQEDVLKKFSIKLQTEVNII